MFRGSLILRFSGINRYLTATSVNHHRCDSGASFEFVILLKLRDDGTISEFTEKARSLRNNHGLGFNFDVAPSLVTNLVSVNF
jgi:hypothetical protein